MAYPAIHHRDLSAEAPEPLDEKDIDRLLTIPFTDFKEELLAHPNGTLGLSDSALEHLFGDIAFLDMMQTPDFSGAFFTTPIGFSLAQWPRVMALIAQSRHIPDAQDTTPCDLRAWYTHLHHAERGLVALLAFASTEMTNGLHMQLVLARLGKSLPGDLVRMMLAYNHLPYHTTAKLRRDGLPCIIANNACMAGAYLRISELYTLMRDGLLIEHCLGHRHDDFLKLMPKSGLQHARHALWHGHWQHTDWTRLLGRDTNRIAWRVVCLGRHHTLDDPYLDYPYVSYLFGPQGVGIDCPLPYGIRAVHPMDMVQFFIRFHQFHQPNHPQRRIIYAPRSCYLHERPQDAIKLLLDIANHFTEGTLTVPGTALRRLSPASYWMQCLGPTVLVMLLLALLLILLHEVLLPALSPSFFCTAITQAACIVGLVVALHFATPARFRNTLIEPVISTLYFACFCLPVIVLGLTHGWSWPFFIFCHAISIASILLFSLFIATFEEKRACAFRDLDYRPFSVSLTPLRDVWRHRFVDVYLTGTNTRYRW